MANNNFNLAQELNQVHAQLIARMTRINLKKQAAELQSILQDIKRAAKDFDGVTDSVIGNIMKNEFDELIAQTFRFQSQFHGGNLQANTLFRRKHNQVIKTVAEADDIFEEDLASLIAAGEFLGTKDENITIQHFLFGGKSTETKSSENFKNLEVELEKDIKDGLEKLAQKENKRISTQVQKATGKVDISGKNISLNYRYPLPFRIERLMTLMKDATFSAKNYKSTRYYENDVEIKQNLSQIGIHLGNSNLYKAVTGALSEIGKGYKQQAKFFKIGLYEILKDPSGEVAKHFSHLRFMYELRGSGLLGPDGLVLPVKYIIYNDPTSDDIFVRDTASIILEAFEKSTRKINLTGDVSLAASIIARD